MNYFHLKRSKDERLLFIQDLTRTHFLYFKMLKGVVVFLSCTSIYKK